MCLCGRHHQTQLTSTLLSSHIRFALDPVSIRSQSLVPSLLLFPRFVFVLWHRLLPFCISLRYLFAQLSTHPNSPSARGAKKKEQE